MSLSYGKYTSEIKSGVIFDNDSFIPEIQSEESHSLFFFYGKLQLSIFQRQLYGMRINSLTANEIPRVTDNGCFPFLNFGVD